MSNLPPASPQGLDALWTEIERHPTDREVHERFVRFAVTSRQYEAAATKYADLETEPPPVGPLAIEYRKRIALDAAAQILAREPRTEVPKELSRIAKLALLLGGAGLVLAMIFGSAVLAATATPLLAFGAYSFRRGRRLGA